MQAIYPYAQLIHLICAIIFVGFLFFEVIIFSRAKAKLPADIAQKAQQAISSVAIKIMPLCVSPLALTGGMMTGGRVGSKAGGYFASNLQTALMIKVILAMLIFAAVATNLTCKFILKCPSPLGNIHPFAFAAAAAIVILAKVMFMV